MKRFYKTFIQIIGAIVIKIIKYISIYILVKDKHFFCRVQLFQLFHKLKVITIVVCDLRALKNLI